MVFGGGGNGQWVRTHNDDSAKLFLAELERDNPIPRRTPWQRRILLGVTVVALVAVVVFLLLG